MCDKIWRDTEEIITDKDGIQHRVRSRFGVLKKVVEICGDVNTPKSRYFKAKAWGWNSTAYSKETIAACEEYLNNPLYEEAQDIKNGHRDMHIAEFRRYLARAYANNTIKDYNSAEKIYKKDIESTYSLASYLNLARFYWQTKRIDDAISLLRNASLMPAKYPFEYHDWQDKRRYMVDKQKWEKENNELYTRRLSEELKKYENLKMGVYEHTFSGYDRIETFYDDKTGRNMSFELGLYNKLKSKYTAVFESHRELLQKMDFLKAKIKEVGLSDELINQEYINTCLADISLYDDLVTFYYELNKLGLKNEYEIYDNCKKGYHIFKNLSMFYEKQNKIDEAIKVCQLAIEKGIIEDGTKGQMAGRIERLAKKLNKKIT